MAAPVIILLFTFLLAPFVLAFGFSLTNQRLFSPTPAKYVGLTNFKRLLTVRTLRLEPLTGAAAAEVAAEAGVDENGLVYMPLRSIVRNNPAFPRYAGLQELRTWYRGDTKVVLLTGDALFVRAFINTLGFVLIVVPAQGGLALFLALLLNTRRRGINIYRTIYFMPVVLSIVVTALLWRFIFDGHNGLLNTLLGSATFGAFKPIDWLGSPRTAPMAVIIMSIWQAVGFHMVIWLAGLQNIPSDRYEAASIDGASYLQQFRYIIWPGLRNTAVFVFIIITMQAFTVFTQIDLMTRGGPLNSTQTLVFQIVERGFRRQTIGGASALSVFYFLMVLAISLLQRYLTRDKP